MLGERKVRASRDRRIHRSAHATQLQLLFDGTLVGRRYGVRGPNGRQCFSEVAPHSVRVLFGGAKLFLELISLQLEFVVCFAQGIELLRESLVVVKRVGDQLPRLRVRRARNLGEAARTAQPRVGARCCIHRRCRADAPEHVRSSTNTLPIAKRVP